MENKEKRFPDIRKSLLLNARLQKVWETVATKEGLESWLMPNDFEAKVGHKFTMKTPYGPQPCQVLELDPPLSSFFFLGSVRLAGHYSVKRAGWKNGVDLDPCRLGRGGSGDSRRRGDDAEVHQRMEGGWEGVVLPKLREVAEA